MNIIRFRRLHHEDNPVIILLTSKWKEAKGVDLETMAIRAIVFILLAPVLIIVGAAWSNLTNKPLAWEFSAPVILIGLGLLSLVAAWVCMDRFQFFGNVIAAVEFECAKEKVALDWQIPNQFLRVGNHASELYLGRTARELKNLREHEGDSRKMRSIIEKFAETHQDHSAIFELSSFSHFEQMTR